MKRGNVHRDFTPFSRAFKVATGSVFHSVNMVWTYFFYNERGVRGRRRKVPLFPSLKMRFTTLFECI